MKEFGNYSQEGGIVKNFLTTMFLVCLIFAISAPIRAQGTNEVMVLSGTIGASKIAKTYIDNAEGKFDLGQSLQFSVGFRTADKKWKFVASGGWQKNTGSEVDVVDYSAEGQVSYYLWWDKTKRWGAYVGFAGGHEWLDFQDDYEGTLAAFMASNEIGVERMLSEDVSLLLGFNFGTSKSLSEVGVNISFETPLRL